LCPEEQGCWSRVPAPVDRSCTAEPGGGVLRSADPAGLPDMLGWLIRRIWAAWPLRIDGITAMYLVSRPSFADAATAALAVPCLCRGRCHA
jgi:hypothetical protein